MSDSLFRFRCPKCNKNLKTPNAISPEKLVTCPRCGHQFKCSPSTESVTPKSAANNLGLTIWLALGSCVAGMFLVVVVVAVIMLVKNIGHSEVQTAESSASMSDETTTSGEAADSSVEPSDERQPVPLAPPRLQTPSPGTLVAEETEPHPVWTTSDDPPSNSDVTNRPGDGSEPAQPNGSEGVDVPFDAGNRPDGDGGLEQLQGNPSSPKTWLGDSGSGPGARNPASPIIIEVPVMIPIRVPVSTRGGGTSKGTGPGKTAAGSTPELSVLISPEDKRSSVMMVDHVSSPGLSAKLEISLDRTPKSQVQVSIAPDTGLAADKSQITFPANTSPKKQLITISGNGKASQSKGPSQILFVNISAKGNELKSGAPAKIPIRVVRRNSFRITSTFPVTRITRGDAPTFPASSGLPRNTSNWAMPGATGNAVKYQSEYVELVGTFSSTGRPTPVVRVLYNHVEVETRPLSGVFRSTATGSWE